MADKLFGKRKKFIQKTIDKINETGKPANFLAKNTISIYCASRSEYERPTYFIYDVSYFTA